MAFQAGKSGNPNGRPVLSGEFKQALSESTMEALAVVREVMNNPKARNFDRITAAKYILDKSLGLNYQLFSSEDTEDNSIIVRIVKADGNPKDSKSKTKQKGNK